MTQRDESNSHLTLTKLEARVPADLQAKVRAAAEERSQSVSEYMRAALAAAPPDVRESELLVARYRMALETIIEIGPSYSDTVDIAKLALGVVAQ